MSKDSVYENNKVLYGDFLPKVYIDKIVLSGREDQGEQFLIVDVHCAIKDSADANGNYLLIDNTELLKLIDIDVLVSTDPKVENLIDGTIDIAKIAYSPLFPNPIASTGTDATTSITPEYIELMGGNINNEYYRVSEGEHTRYAWVLRENTLPLSFKSVNLHDVALDLTGLGGGAGMRDVAYQLTTTLPSIEESDDNSSRTVKILEGGKMVVTHSIHRNLLTGVPEMDEDAYAFLYEILTTGEIGGMDLSEMGFDDLGASLAESLREMDSGGNIFPEDLYVFAYARLKHSSEFWGGVATFEAGLDNLAQMPRFKNEFTGEVAYEKIIDEGQIKFREYKYFTENDKLYQGEVILNTNGDYVRAINYNNQRIAQEVVDRVLTLIDINTETDAKALRYYAEIVSVLTGRATDPILFNELYKLLPTLNDRRGNTSAGKIANAFSDLMTQLNNIFSTAEIVYQKMVRNSKYFDKRVKGLSLSGTRFCSPVEWKRDADRLGHISKCIVPNDTTTLAPGGGEQAYIPTPHSEILLTGDVKTDTFSNPMGANVYNFIEEGGYTPAVETWWARKKVNGFFMLNIENMMLRKEYHPIEEMYVMVPKLLHHFGFNTLAKYFFIDKIKINRGAGLTRSSYPGNHKPFTSLDEHVVTFRVSHQESTDYNDGTPPFNTSQFLSPSIVAPSLLEPGRAPGAPYIPREGTMMIERYSGTKHEREPFGLNKRREAFAAGIVDITSDQSATLGDPDGDGHIGTGLVVDVNYPYILKNSDKTGKVLLVTFAEAVRGMFGADDLVEDGFLDTSGRAVDREEVHLKYVADYEVVNNIGGLCYVIHRFMKGLLTILDSYAIYAERTCSYDTRTGKFNEFFGDNFHKAFEGELELGWWVRPCALYVIVQDLLYNTHGGDAGIMRETTFNLIQAIDPKSGTIQALRDFQDNFRSLMGKWEETFGGTYNPFTESFPYYKGYKPRDLDPMNVSDNVVHIPMAGSGTQLAPYGKFHPWPGGRDLTLPVGYFQPWKAFSAFQTVMQSLQEEEDARAQRQLIKTIKAGCAGIRHELHKRGSNQVRFAVGMLDNPRGIEDDLGPILTETNLSVNNRYISKDPTPNSGYKASQTEQEQWFRKYLIDGGSVYVSPGLSSYNFVDRFFGRSPLSGHGKGKGSWERYMEAALGINQGGSQNVPLQAGVANSFGEIVNYPYSISNLSTRSKAFNHERLREQIRKGLRSFVQLMMTKLKSCSGMSAERITNEFFGGDWPFDALGEIDAGPPGQRYDSDASSSEDPGQSGWGTIDMSKRRDIIKLLDAVGRLRNIGLWPFLFGFDDYHSTGGVGGNTASTLIEEAVPIGDLDADFGSAFDIDPFE